MAATSTVRLIARMDRDSTETQRGEVVAWFARTQFGFIAPDKGGGDIIARKVGIAENARLPVQRVAFQEHVTTACRLVAVRVALECPAI